MASRDNRSAATRRKSAARLAAVQAMYEAAFTGMADVEPVLMRAVAANRGATLTEDQSAEVDQQFYADLLRGAWGRRGECDAMIAKGLSNDWNPDRLEPLLRAVLRCGLYELLASAAVPARVVITEYVGVAEDFFAEKEPRMVNAVLDRVARVLREDEFSTASGKR